MKPDSINSPKTALQAGDEADLDENEGNSVPVPPPKESRGDEGKVFKLPSDSNKPSNVFLESFNTKGGGFPLLRFSLFSKSSSSRTLSPSFMPPSRSRRDRRNLITTMDVAQLEAGTNNAPVLLDLTLNKSTRAQIGEPKSNGRNFVVGVVITMLVVIGTVVGVSVALATSSSSSSSSICGSSDKDFEIRSLIAQNFDAATVNAGAVVYDGIVLKCLPFDIFAELNEAQLIVLSTVNQIKFDHNGITKISAEAFNSDSAPNLDFIVINNNGLLDLPDNAFEAVPNVKQIDLQFNGLSDINPRAFDGMNDLQVLVLDGNSAMTTIPEVVANIDTLRELHLKNCPSLVDVAENLFLGLDSLETILLTGSAILNQFQSVQEFKDHAGLATSVNVVTS